MVCKQWLRIAISQQVWAQKLAPPLQSCACLSAQASLFVWPCLWSDLHCNNLLEEVDWTACTNDRRMAVVPGDGTFICTAGNCECVFRATSKGRGHEVACSVLASARERLNTGGANECFSGMPWFCFGEELGEPILQPLILAGRHLPIYTKLTLTPSDSPGCRLMAPQASRRRLEG